MDREALKKLKVLLHQKFREVTRPLPHGGFARWKETCASLGIRPIRPLDGRLVNEPRMKIVVVEDPAAGGHLLEMTEETADKILVLGLP